VAFVGVEYAFDVVVSGRDAQAVVDSFVSPAGWAFGYSEAERKCDWHFGRGRVVYSTSDICTVG
jgi:hypothetical protein